MKTVKEIIAFIRSLENDKTKIFPCWNEIADNLENAYKNEVAEVTVRVVELNNELVAKVRDLTIENAKLAKKVYTYKWIYIEPKTGKELGELDDRVNEATETLRKEIAELKRENEQVKEQRNRAHLEAGERYGELLARCNDALRDILLFDADFGDLDEFDCCECKFCAVGDGGCWRGKAIGMQNAILKAKEIMKRQESRNV